MIRMVTFDSRYMSADSDDCFVLRRYDGQKVELSMPFNGDFSNIRLSASEALTLLVIIDQAHVLTNPSGRSKIMFFPFGEEMYHGSYCFLIRGNNHFLEIDMGFSDFIPIRLYGQEIYDLKQALKEIIDVKYLPFIR